MGELYLPVSYTHLDVYKRQLHNQSADEVCKEAGKRPHGIAKHNRRALQLIGRKRIDIVICTANLNSAHHPLGAAGKEK